MRDVFKSANGMAVTVVICLVVFQSFGMTIVEQTADITARDAAIAAQEQAIEDLEQEVENIEQQQQQGIRSMIGCVNDEAVCFRQHEEQNEHGLLGRVWYELWCCPGPNTMAVGCR